MYNGQNTEVVSLEVQTPLEIAVHMTRSPEPAKSRNIGNDQELNITIKKIHEGCNYSQILEFLIKGNWESKYQM